MEDVEIGLEEKVEIIVQETEAHVREEYGRILAKVNYSRVQKSLMKLLSCGI